jgi:hypothetical protein
MPRRTPSAPHGEAPAGFQVEREFPTGRHPLLAVFPRLDRLETAKRLEPNLARRGKLFEETCVEVVDEDVWMYVAPWDVPPGSRGWRPVLSPGTDCIVIGRTHLQTSDLRVLFMDIFHELRHVLQRHDGAELFDRSVSYVRRPTEIDAYRFVVQEARRLGVSDEFLREYLRVEWIDEDEYHELLKAMDVPRW